MRNCVRSAIGLIAVLTMIVSAVIAAPIGVTSTSALAESAPLDQKIVTLTGTRTVNIRTGPGLDYPYIGEVYPGASFIYTGVSENGYHQILFPNTAESGDDGTQSLYVNAYVAARLSRVSSAATYVNVYSTIAGTVKVRRGAPVYLSAAYKLKTGAKITNYASMTFLGVSSTGAYAVLFPRMNGSGKWIMWMGFVSPRDIIQEY
ncbi:hypothetical protein FACS1894184_06750 [Clostridia bacterium]|nr:hypothetical protein FACS1894184_06750 [Clostridia bacterium]